MWLPFFSIYCLSKSPAAFVQIGSHSCSLFYLMKIAKCSRISSINLCRFFQQLSCLFVLLLLHIDQRQQMISLDQIRILRQNLFQLNHGHILIILFAVQQRLIILLYGLIDGLQFVFIGLQLCNIEICRIIFFHGILTDDPFTQGGNHFSRLIIHQTQQVSGINVLFIKLQTSLQTGNRTRQIPDTGLLQSFIV